MRPIFASVPEGQLRSTARRELWRWCWLLVVSSLVWAACGLHRSSDDAADADAELDEALAQGAMLLADTGAPTFFLSSESNAPAIGFGSGEAKLVVREDPSENGRTPVRVLGRLHLEAYVPDGAVELRVQENTTLRGTPVVVRAGDRVQLIKPRNNAGEHRVAARIPVESLLLGPFESRLPAGLLSARGPRKLNPLVAGMAYRWPSGTALPLYDEPRGVLLSLVPAQTRDLTVAVLNIERDWLFVRVGRGPFLQGFTQAPLVLIGKAAPATPLAAHPTNPSRTRIPWRIAQNPGALMRVQAGTQLRFHGRIVATFRGAGWARALSEPHEAEVELLAAIDDQVTVRGVAPRDALSQVRDSDFGLSPPTGIGSASELGSAWVPAASQTE